MKIDHLHLKSQAKSITLIWHIFLKVGHLNYVNKMASFEDYYLINNIQDFGLMS